MVQPRDIHGTPLYVGDRVAIATERGQFGVGEPELIVRVITSIENGLIWVPEIDGFEGVYGCSDTPVTFLRLP